MKSSVLVTKRIFQQAIDYLKQHADVEYVETDDGLPAEELMRRIQGKQGIVSQLTDKFTPAVLEKLPDLRVISNVAVGFDNVDVPAATKRKIFVTNTPDVLTDTTADFAFALLMAGRAAWWRGTSLCIPASGTSGASIYCWARTCITARSAFLAWAASDAAVAQRGRGFSMRILYHDAVRAPEAVERELGAELVSAERLLRESDFVSLHVPLSAETRHLIGAAQLRLMKKTAILVNSSRGPVVDEPALAAALQEGVIAGAALDVFEHEPKVHPTLLKLPNVVVAPHIASASVATRLKMCMMAAENVVAALEGRRPPNLLNAELWTAGKKA